MVHHHGRGTAPGTDTCLVCHQYEMIPPGKAVDVTSDDEADWLCPPHRAKCTEGFCVLCGHRPGWMTIFDVDVSVCRQCHVSRNGEAAAERAEVAWKEFEGTEEEGLLHH